VSDISEFNVYPLQTSSAKVISREIGCYCSWKRQHIVLECLFCDNLYKFICVFRISLCRYVVYISVCSIVTYCVIKERENWGFFVDFWLVKIPSSL